MVFLTISDEEQILIDAEEVSEDLNDVKSSIKCIKQRGEVQTDSFIALKRIRFSIIEMLKKVVNLPNSGYSHFVGYILENNNDFISIP